MFNQTDTKFVLVSLMADDLIAFGRKRHERYRIITDFQGVINKPVFSANGDMVYMEMSKEDKAIIPKVAFRRLAATKKAGFPVAQVIIGHELEITPEISDDQPILGQGIDWKDIVETAADGLLAGITGIATVALYALGGVFLLFDPSLCVVLDDGIGTVVELLRWNTEA